MPTIWSGTTPKVTSILSHHRKVTRRLDRRRNVFISLLLHWHVANESEPTVITALDKSKAKPAEIISGKRVIRPSKRARRAAGLPSDDEASSESDTDAEDTTTTGSKRKKTKKPANLQKKKKTASSAPKTSARNSTSTDATDQMDVDADPTDKEADSDNQGDEADDYEKLRAARDIERPVSEINVLL